MSLDTRRGTSKGDGIPFSAGTGPKPGEIGGCGEGERGAIIPSEVFRCMRGPIRENGNESTGSTSKRALKSDVRDLLADTLVGDEG